MPVPSYCRARSGRSPRTSGSSWTTFSAPCPDLSLPEKDRAYWGTSPGGGSWSTLGGVGTDYSVVPGAGKIALTTDNASRHASLRDGEITDVDVRSVASFDKVPTGEACSYALSFGYQDTHNNYRARLSFSPRALSR